MSSKLEGIPAEVVSAELEQGSVSMLVDQALYPLEALYGASYIFIDRCYVLLDVAAPGQYRVTLSYKKNDADEAGLRAMIGEFANELLSCAWRHQITKENQAALEAVTAQAIAGAMGPPSLDDLAAFDFTDEKFDDPLGIALSWEEKYKRKDKDDEPAGAPSAEAKLPEAAPTAEAGPAAEAPAPEVKSA